MLVPYITLATASVLGILFVVLSAAVSSERGRSKIGLGTGAETTSALGKEHEAPRLLIAVRRHAHFAEYVPLSLILLMLLEFAGADRRVLLGLAAALIICRLMITAGLGRAAPNILRAGGSAIQYLMIFAAGIYGLAVFAQAQGWI
ncbi:MAG TPA: MAPEG family protein [Rhizomicrobium sp.]|nr:MAPEG family protein [Rhizomicrobium sp.]